MLDSYWQALLLGILQGLTEFLPISSSGHLALAQRAMDLDADSPEMLLFDVAIHVATLLAVAVVFRTSFRRFAVRLFRDLTSKRPPSSRRSWLDRAVAVRITLWGIAASVPTAAIGLGFKDTLEAAFAKPAWIGLALAMTGTLLLVTSGRTRTRKGWRQFSLMAAIAVGVAQGIAIMPGVSRSGTTICVAMLLGLRRRWAAEFSFFLAVPAILGATLIKVRDVAELPGDVMAGLPIGAIGVGCAAAFVVGLGALQGLLIAVRRARLAGFGYYCYGLAAVILTLVALGRL